MAIAPWFTKGLMVWVGERSAATALLKGIQLPLWPIFLLTVLPPRSSTARASVKSLLMDSMGTVVVDLPAS